MGFHLDGVVLYSVNKLDSFSIRRARARLPRKIKA